MRRPVTPRGPRLRRPGLLVTPHGPRVRRPGLLVTLRGPRVRWLGLLHAPWGTAGIYRSILIKTIQGPDN